MEAYPKDEGSPFDWTELVSHIVVQREYETDKSNMEGEHKELNDALDMLICDRAEKDYDWMSDIFIPDYPSIHWTQIGELVAQYFSREEKVDCPPSTEGPDDIWKAKAGKSFLNYHLNAIYLHYLQKFIRAMSFNRLGGWCVIKGWYESDVKMVPQQTGTRKVPRETGFDIYGESIETSPYPSRVVIEDEPIMEEVKQINIDRPNFDVWPNQDVFMDNKYVYSLQDKDHIIFRSEEKLSELKNRVEACQYFNLEKLQQESETDTEKATYNKNSNAGDKYDRIVQRFNPDVEILERWGTWPVLFNEEGPVIEQTENGTIRAVSGIDDQGNLMEGAQSVEMIITVANIKKGKVLIRFQPNDPQFGGYGFRPMTRLLCYVHPTKDRGIGDGKYAQELQVGINDTFNMNNDRTRMATFPTIKKRKYALVDNDTLMFGPEHVMELENMDDVDIFQISDNIQGGLIQQDMLFNKLQQITATWTHDMGGVPGRKQPVTTMMLAEQKSNIRTSLVNLTVEHTGLKELYSMILKMSGLFMQPETLINILGELTPFFDPESEYNFVPVSTAILTEHAKESKIQMWDQILGRIINIPNPNTFLIINFILKEIMELYGKEYGEFANALLDPNAINPNYLAPLMQAQAQQQSAQETGGQQSKKKVATQNQYGNPQSFLEQMGRRLGTQAGGGNM